MPNWLKTYGKPRIVVSDQEPQYMSLTFAKFLGQQEIKYRLTSEYNPSGNGKAERLNSTINYIMRIYIGKSLDEIETAIYNNFNEGFHRVVKCAPNQIKKKLSPLNPLEIEYDPPLEVFRKRNRDAELLNRKKINKSRTLHNYCVGDLVLIKLNQAGKSLPIY